MDSSIIIIDSDDEDFANKELKTVLPTSIQNGKRQNDTAIDHVPAKQRRIQPLKIGEIDKTKFETSSSQQIGNNSPKDASCSMDISTSSNTQEDESPTKDEASTKPEKRKNEQTKEFEAFIVACRKAENNSDMKKIIKTKLIKYYDLVHPDYAQSKHLRKMLEDTALAIHRDPKTVYSKLQDVISELKSRKNCGPIIVVEQPVESSQDENGVEIAATGDEKKDGKLKKLNKALTKLKKAIEDLEEAEVNLDEEEDSAYMKKVRYEKRAVEIYNKICEITGESTTAHRIIKQPIKFKGSKYKEFNKRLSKKINKENGFPSYYDVFRLLDFCNKEYSYGLYREEIQNDAQSAFVEVGKLLKERRCNDLFESAEHYAGKNKDPAKEDSELKAKLEKNKEFYKKKTEEILQLYVTKQMKVEEGGSEFETGEPSTAGDFEEDKKVNDQNDSSVDLRTLPTEKLLSIIDIKTECDTNVDEKKNAPVIDLAITL